MRTSDTFGLPLASEVMGTIDEAFQTPIHLGRYERVYIY